MISATKLIRKCSMINKMKTQNDFCYFDILQFFVNIRAMEEETSVCQICCQDNRKNQKVQLKCKHTFCSACLKQYIQVLKLYRQLTPSKLSCLHEGCEQQINDETLMSLFPGEEGFIFKTIKKCYKEAKNATSTIFSCNGIIRTDRKPLIQKQANMSRQEHSKLINQLIKQILAETVVVQSIKSCNNIHIYNKGVSSKEKTIMCYVCGCSYCLSCFEFSHQGSCPIKQSDPKLNLKKIKGQDNFEDFIAVNQIRRCLNPKCTIPIDKQQGCYWVKCRCSWEMCYPCGKLWGNCQHFSKYPYQKFIPPADWLVKALNLY